MCAERDAPIVDLETTPDRVRLLVTVDPRYGIHRLVKQIKGPLLATARAGSSPTCGPGFRPY